MSKESMRRKILQALGTAVVCILSAAVERIIDRYA